jgi:ABC-type amino acid transport substrate-binding protein
MYPLHSTDLPQHSYLNLTLAPETTADITATIHTNYPTRQKTDNASEGSTLHRIQRTQTLRVGHNPNIIPFCYRNSDGDLVGYDIAHAYALARALNTRLEFIPFEWDTLLRDLDEHRFDIAMAGIYATSERLRRVEVSSVYYQSPLALIVPTKRAHEFLHMDDIHKRARLRIAVFNDPVLEPAAKRLFPQAEMVVCHDYNQLPDLADIDAALWTLEQARIWAGEHAGFTAVRPAGLTGVEVFAYLMPPDSPELVRFVNRWLQLMQARRFSEQCKTYWIDGHKRP